MLRLLCGSLALRVKFAYPLIPTICQNHTSRPERCLTRLEESKILLLALTKGSCQYLSRRIVRYELCFLRVSFLLSRVGVSLFFFGRSQGHSVASIMTTSKEVSLSRSTFLPGRWKRVSWRRMLSNCRSVLPTVVSWTP